MTFERFYKEFVIIFGRLLAILIAKGVITQKDADFINCQISEEEWKESEAKKEVKAIETEHSCVTCKFGNLYSDSEPCCNCTDDNDMYEPIESEADNEQD